MQRRLVLRFKTNKINLLGNLRSVRLVLMEKEVKFLSEVIEMAVTCSNLEKVQRKSILGEDRIDRTVFSDNKVSLGRTAWRLEK